jgi:hypothetical protein
VRVVVVHQTSSLRDDLSLGSRASRIGAEVDAARVGSSDAVRAFHAPRRPVKVPSLAAFRAGFDSKVLRIRGPFHALGVIWGALKCRRRCDFT